VRAYRRKVREKVVVGLIRNVEDNKIWAKKQTSHHVRRKKT